MFRYLLGWLAGFITIILIMNAVVIPENLWIDVVMVAFTNIVLGITAYKYHKRKQRNYYDRFKVRR